MNLRVLIMLAGGAAAVWSFRRWREAVQLALVLLIFEGAIRKWVFPGAQDLIYFAKDVLLLGAYAGFFRERPRLRLPAAVRPGAATAVLVLSAAGRRAADLQPEPAEPAGGRARVQGLLLLRAAAVRAAGGLPGRRRAAPVPAALRADRHPGRRCWPWRSSSARRRASLNTYARTTQENAYIATFGSSTYVRVTATFSFITGYTVLPAGHRHPHPDPARGERAGGSGATS